MIKSFRGKLMLLGLVLVAVVAPSAALAGKKVVSGKQSSQLNVSVTPAKAGAAIATLHLHNEYHSTVAGGGQPPYNTKSVIFKLPKGMTYKPKASATCKESATAKSPNGAAVCPAGSKIGKGTVTVNARPTVAKLITGKVTIYIGVDDSGAGGYPKGSPVVMLYVTTSIHVDATDYFHVVKKGGSVELIANGTKPSKPGVAPGSFTIQTIDLSTFNAGKNPPTCHGSWRFSLTTTNFFGQPSVTAPDSVKCKK